ncbi:MAG TPA: lysylphosphatidylglycerol synthase transmembrane domain-containing protein [Candidatus Paceibacterota bacterium]
MKRVILFVGSLLVGLFLFGFLISGVGWQKVWEPLEAFSLFNALVIVLLTGAFLLVGVLRWQLVLRGQGCSIPFSSVWRPYLAGFSLSFFVPIITFASEFFRASALGDLHKIEFDKGMASVLIDRILEVTSNLFVVIMGGVLFLFAERGIPYSIKTLGIICFVGIWFLVVSLLYIRIFQKRSVIRMFWRGKGSMHDVEREVFLFFYLKNRFFWQGLFFSFVKSAIGLARVWALIFFLGKGFAWIAGVTILGFYYLAVLVPIPAALGSHEALQAVGFGIFGLGAGTGAAFALVVRAVEILFASLGLALFFHLGLRFMKKMIFRV